MAITDDLQRLFNLQNETLSVEFKSWLDLTTNDGKAPLAKAAIALANHGGGTIIMGMREAADKPVGSYPRPSGVYRYTADSVNAAVNRYADPHIHCDVVHLSHPQTSYEHAFVIVPGGHSVPIMSVRDATGSILSQRCYIRKPGPKSEEPFTSEEWRALISRCVQNGRESLLDAFRIILQGQSLNAVPIDQVDELQEFSQTSFERWKLRLQKLPADHTARFSHGFYEQAYQIHNVESADGLRELKSRLKQASETKMTGWGPFVFMDRSPIGPMPVGDAIEAWIVEDNVRDGRHSDFWRVSPSGLLYEVRSLEEDFTEKVRPGTAIDLTLPIWRIGETLLYVARLAKLFGADPEISIMIKYQGLMDREMKSLFEPRYLSYDRKCAVDSVILKGGSRASIIEENTVEVLLPLLTPLYEAFDFAPLTSDLISRELGEFRHTRF